jgi:hypothetical protein
VGEMEIKQQSLKESNENYAKHYINFICNALTASSTDVDKYYLQNKQSIDSYAKLMLEKYPVERKTLFRGILLENHKSSRLNPLTHIQFLSFSESLKVAQDFADINSSISFAMRQSYPNSEGYLITHTPSYDEILFHYSWVDLLGLDWYLPKDSIELIRDQKEVTIKQAMRSFELQKYDPRKKV